MAVLSVADQVDDDIMLELGTPIGGELADKVDGLDVVGIDVEYGRVNGLGDIRAVGGGTSKTRVSGETNLVVDDEVNGTTGREGREGVEAKAFVDDTLGGESGITVEQDAHGGPVSLLVIVVVLDSTGLAQDDRVLSLQVGGVGNERELHALTRRRGALKVHTKMVLDVTRAFLGGASAGKLAEDGLVGLADDVAEHVETATVGHTDDNVLDTVVDGAIDEGLHTGDQSLAALETETLVVGVFRREEGLEAGAPDEAVEDAALLVDGVLEGLGHLEALAQPVALFAVGDVDELDTVGARVDLLAGGDNVAEGHLVAALALETGQDTRAEGVLGVHVLFGKAVVLQGQLLRFDVTEAFGAVADAQGVDVGLVVAAGLVGTDEQLHHQVVGDVGAVLHGQAAAEARDAAGHVGDQVGGRLEGLGDGHVATLHVLEVDLP